MTATADNLKSEKDALNSVKDVQKLKKADAQINTKTDSQKGVSEKKVSGTIENESKENESKENESKENESKENESKENESIAAVSKPEQSSKAEKKAEKKLEQTGKTEKSRSSRYGFWMGMGAGVIVTLLVVSYPVYLGIDFGKSQQVMLNDVQAQNLNLKIVAAAEELEIIEAQLADIAIAEREYKELLSEKAELESKRVEATRVLKVLQTQQIIPEKTLVDEIIAQ